MDFDNPKVYRCTSIFNDLGLHGTHNFDKKGVINSALRWLISYAEKGGKLHITAMILIKIKGGLRLCVLMQKWPLIEPGESIYRQFFTSMLL